MTETSMTGTAAWPAGRRITIRDLQAATDRGERWSMLTSYDTLTAGVFESVPAELGRQVSSVLRVPVVGIGAGSHCDAQITATRPPAPQRCWPSYRAVAIRSSRPTWTTPKPST
jgi:hypothetical protein